MGDFAHVLQQHIFILRRLWPIIGLTPSRQNPCKPATRRVFFFWGPVRLDPTIAPPIAPRPLICPCPKLLLLNISPSRLSKLILTV